MYWGTSRWSAMEIMVNADLTLRKAHSLQTQCCQVMAKVLIDNHFVLSVWHQEAYSVARQFNLIPPVCEQAEYHYFQRDKVEVQLPELYHKIGQTSTVSQLYLS